MSVTVGASKKMLDLRRLITQTNPNVLVSALRWLLRVCSLPYRAATFLRNAAYDFGILKTNRLGIPVVSIGNLSVGGTGKTPAVAWLARYLCDRNLRIAVVSRGYGQLDSGQNDEALELELRLPDVPHIQNIDRVAAARLAEQDLGVQMILLDDGFQHRRLARDLDVVLIDASDPPAAHWMLPGGLLREPFSSLARAQIIVLTRVDQATAANIDRLRRRIAIAAPRATLVTAKHSPGKLRSHADLAQSTDLLRSERVLAFCGIGNPDSFFAMLKSLSAHVVAERRWPDHHAYTATDVADLAAWTRQFPDTPWLICTMKDWVKLRWASIGQAKLGAVEIEFEIISGRDDIEHRLQPLIDKAVASIER